jgi:hypothetical protein
MSNAANNANNGENKMKNANITIISFNVSTADIADLTKMTAEAQALIMGVERIESATAGEVIGHNGRRAVWSALASFDDESGKWNFRNLGNGRMVNLWK